MDRGLTQREVAELIDVSEASVWKWEAGEVRDPEIRTMPAVIKFLGYLPFGEMLSLSRKLRAYRSIYGYTQKEAARQVGIDPTTWRDWENGSTLPRNVRAKKAGRQIRDDVAQFRDFIEAGVSTNCKFTHFADPKRPDSPIVTGRSPERRADDVHHTGWRAGGL